VANSNTKMGDTHISGARTSSKWSKYDAVSMRRTQTDHWAKMKHVATTFDVKMPEVFVLKRQLPPEALQYKLNPDGSVMPMKGESFDEQLQSTILGSAQRPKLKRSKSIPNLPRYRNEFNDRARQGFKYWPLSRPKPTTYGKYGLGCYKSVLGLGDAVRT
jgi:hypothetical protein